MRSFACLCFLFLFHLSCLFDLPAYGNPIEFLIGDAEEESYLPSWCHLKDQAGQAILPSSTQVVPNLNGWFYTTGKFSAELIPEATYILRVARGIEWGSTEQTFHIDQNDKQVVLKLRPWIRLSQNLLSGSDFSVQLPEQLIEPYLVSQDLDVAFQVFPATHSPLAPEIRHIPGKRAMSLGNIQLKQFQILNSLKSLPVDETPFRKTELHHVKWGVDEGAWIDVLKPSSPEVPVAIALKWVKSISLSRQSTLDSMLEDFESYYRFLNCGFKLPPSAGSNVDSSGWFEQPFPRVYALNKKSFSLGNILTGIERGNSFVTNGPVISLSVDGMMQGSNLTTYPGKSLKVEVGARYPKGIDRLEVICNGETIASIPGAATTDHVIHQFELQREHTSWLVARTFHTTPTYINYAHTAPLYISVGGDPLPQPADVRYFASLIASKIEEIESDDSLHPYEKMKLLEWYQAAEKAFLELLH